MWFVTTQKKVHAIDHGGCHAMPSFSFFSFHNMVRMCDGTRKERGKRGNECCWMSGGSFETGKTTRRRCKVRMASVGKLWWIVLRADNQLLVRRVFHAAYICPDNRAAANFAEQQPWTCSFPSNSVFLTADIKNEQWIIVSNQKKEKISTNKNFLSAPNFGLQGFDLYQSIEILFKISILKATHFSANFFEKKKNFGLKNWRHCVCLSKRIFLGKNSWITCDNKYLG